MQDVLKGTADFSYSLPLLSLSFLYMNSIWDLSEEKGEYKHQG